VEHVIKVEGILSSGTPSKQGSAPLISLRVKDTLLNQDTHILLQQCSVAPYIHSYIHFRDQNLSHNNFVGVSVDVTVHPIYLSIYLFIYQPIHCLFIYAVSLSAICFYLFLAIFLSVPIYLSIYLHVSTLYLSIYLSI